MKKNLDHALNGIKNFMNDNPDTVVFVHPYLDDFVREDPIKLSLNNVETFRDKALSIMEKNKKKSPQEQPANKAIRTMEYLLEHPFSSGNGEKDLILVTDDEGIHIRDVLPYFNHPNLSEFNDRFDITFLQYSTGDESQKMRETTFVEMKALYERYMSHPNSPRNKSSELAGLPDHIFQTCTGILQKNGRLTIRLSQSCKEQEILKLETQTSD